MLEVDVTGTCLARLLGQGVGLFVLAQRPESLPYLQAVAGVHGGSDRLVGLVRPATLSIEDCLGKLMVIRNRAGRCRITGSCLGLAEAACQEQSQQAGRHPQGSRHCYFLLVFRIATNSAAR